MLRDVGADWTESTVIAVERAARKGVGRGGKALSVADVLAVLWALDVDLAELVAADEDTVLVGAALMSGKDLRRRLPLRPRAKPSKVTHDTSAIETETRALYPKATRADLKRVAIAAGHAPEIAAARRLRVTPVQVVAASFAMTAKRSGKSRTFSEWRDGVASDWLRETGNPDQDGVTAGTMRSALRHATNELVDALDVWLVRHDVPRIKRRRRARRTTR